MISNQENVMRNAICLRILWGAFKNVMEAAGLAKPGGESQHEAASP
jgi:hypothetical protein